MPTASPAESYANPDLAALRSLTEVDRYLVYMDDHGNVPDEVVAANVQNRSTASCEISMPNAQTVVVHDVEQRVEDGRLRQVILWLGKTAVEVAQNGYLFHFSKPGQRRVGVEVDAARFEEENLRPGIAQALVSPKMSRTDASVALAKAEHLYEDDSLRVSTAVQDPDTGKVIKRKLESLLVRDILLSDWVRMLKDPGNIFGKAFKLTDEDSAVSVMELFAQMELPEDKLPEGPTSLVAAVLPYIKDPAAYRSVEKQLREFRRNQEFYAREADSAGREWALFELELARSIKFGKATYDVRRFIFMNQEEWTDDSLAVLQAHQLGNSHYAMTRELAAILARAKQKLVGDNLCVIVNNEAAISCVSDEDRQAIREVHDALVYAHAQEVIDHRYIHELEYRRNTLLQRQNIRSGGGCSGFAGDTPGGQTSSEELGVGENANPFESGNSAETSDDWKRSKWKRGVCLIRICPSPRPTEVGPCGICRHCQGEFDAGRDPTRGMARTVAPQEPGRELALVVLDLFTAEKPRAPEPGGPRGASLMDKGGR